MYVTCVIPDVDVRPSIPSIPTLEGGGGRRGTGDAGSDGGDSGNGGDSGDGGLEISGDGGDSNIFFGSGDIDDSTVGNGEFVVCIELASGNLQRNVSVNVMTVSSPTSTG